MAEQMRSAEQMLRMLQGKCHAIDETKDRGQIPYQYSKKQLLRQKQ